MIIQILLFLTGFIAIWLSQDKSEHKRKFACLFGLAGQPLWFYSAYTTEQWGIFFLCFAYTYAWIKGFKVNWIKEAHVCGKECKHDSDCAVHNEPAYPNEKCDCKEK